MSSSSAHFTSTRTRTFHLRYPSTSRLPHPIPLPTHRSFPSRYPPTSCSLQYFVPALHHSFLFISYPAIFLSMPCRIPAAPSSSVRPLQTYSPAPQLLLPFLRSRLLFIILLARENPPSGFMAKNGAGGATAKYNAPATPAAWTQRIGSSASTPSSFIDLTTLYPPEYVSCAFYLLLQLMSNGL